MNIYFISRHFFRITITKKKKVSISIWDNEEDVPCLSCVKRWLKKWLQIWLRGFLAPKISIYGKILNCAK
jgi:hypothetical protein